MALTAESEQLKSHAITLRKMGYSIRYIAKELNVSKSHIFRWVSHININTVGHNSIMSHNNTHDMGHQFKSFLGKLEDFETDIRFPLIIADPPWNISQNMGKFEFKDKSGKNHTPMIRNFGEWDFQGEDIEYLRNIRVWLEKLYLLASDNSWCWFWCSYKYLSHINQIGDYVGWEPKGWYVWVKTNVPPLLSSINGTLLSSLEPCLIFRKGNGKLKTNGCGFPNYGKELPMVPTSQRLKGNENVAAKPAGILYDFIEWCTDSGDWVLDAFAGTGSTSRAALYKKRNAYAVESDKRQLTLLQLEIEEKYGVTN